jgi:Transposase domain (DUF772)
MRRDGWQQSHIFSYLSPEMRVRKDPPLRAIPAMVDEVLAQLSRRLDRMYARVGRPSIAPEKLLRAQLLQMLYSVRSERLLMEEIDYNLLFRWFVGLLKSSHTGGCEALLASSIQAFAEAAPVFSRRCNCRHHVFARLLHSA